MHYMRKTEGGLRQQWDPQPQPAAPACPVGAGGGSDLCCLTEAALQGIRVSWWQWKLFCVPLGRQRPWPAGSAVSEPLACLTRTRANPIAFFFRFHSPRERRRFPFFLLRLFDAVHRFSQLPEVYVPHKAEQTRSWPEGFACWLWGVINEPQLQ